MNDGGDESDIDDTGTGTDIAIVGMSGRFPGAPDAEALWERVVAGDDCLVDLDLRELIAAGADPALVRRPEFVPRAGVIDGVDQFDHEFFGISHRDGSVMDPQHRHFMESAWEALESSGHTPEGFGGAIGVFAGSGMNTYLLHNLLTNPSLVEQLGWFLLRHTGNDKDFLTTTLSYRLGLRGPSVNVQTACSTSLVAVHLAVQSLLSFECDMALAGGVTIEFPHGRGYEFREGEVLSPNGRCRAFDAASDGTVITGGAAVVALRRLADARREGDPILAVIKGSAVNNDGNRKVGYLAPSVDGHADVVKEALAVSGVDPRSIGLLEAHGTGTAVGDPIEVAALTEAFRSGTADEGFCRLVSTKPNIGHLDTAAGTASLIKVVQALRHGILPPLANHTGPNPLLDIDRTPFVLSAEAAPWTSVGPRRAGVSSLGVGGTNAHVIVEEAPSLPPTPVATPGQIITLSGASRAAVDAGAERLAAFIEREPDINIADVAHTMISGRRAHRHRRVVVVTDAASAPAELRSTDRRRCPTAEAPDGRPQIAFVFPGGGSQYPGMGVGLDARFDEFHRVRQQGIQIVRGLGGADLGELLAEGGDADMLRQPTASLPAVFITSTALAHQWLAWGVEPDVMVGHSLGEYVAAHLAGVMSYEDALKLVVARSQLIERACAGGAAMLVVPLAEVDVMSRLPHELSLAAVNADTESVVAGPADVVDRFADALTSDGIEVTRIPIAAAGHSSMLDGVLDEFEAVVRTVQLHPPQRPYLSNVTGTWITEQQATDPRYWVQHLRGTVRFADGLRTAIRDRTTVVVELGPGQTLGSYARRSGLPVRTVSTLRHPDDVVSDTNHTLGAFGQMWIHGVDVDLDRTTGGGRRKLRLPTYPFQRERCWIEPGAGSVLGGAGATGSDQVGPSIERFEDVEQMGWRPTWIDAPAPGSAHTERRWVVVGGDDASATAAELRRRGRVVVRVDRFAPDDPELTAEALVGDGSLAIGVVLVGASAGIEEAMSRWLDEATDAVRWLSANATDARFVAVTAKALPASGPASRPVDAMAMGAVLVAPREVEGLSAALVDVADASVEVARVVDEIEGASGIVVLAGANRLAPGPLAQVDPPIGEEAMGIRLGGTYVVTGGLGGVGDVLATHLATRYAANLVVLTTDHVPTGHERDRFLRSHAFDHPTCRRIRRITHLEQLGVKVVVERADVTDPNQIRAALDAAERTIGHIDGAIHAAGRLRDRPIGLVGPDDHRHVVDPKAGAAIVLANELERRGADLLVLVSSTSTIVAPEGQMSYVAANAVLDAMAGGGGSLRIATLSSGVWSGLGMASEAARRLRLELPGSEPIAHPVFAEAGLDHRGEFAAVGQLHATHHWVIGDHRTADGTAVLPGTGHLALMLGAAQLAGVSRLHLDDVSLIEPLIVPDEHPVTLRVVIEPEADGRRLVRIDGDGGHGQEWTTHSEAVLVDAEPALVDLDPGVLATRCALDHGHPMDAAGDGLVLGPMWKLDAHVWLGDGESFGRVELPDPSDTDDGWYTHPSVVDLATGVAIALAAPGRTRLFVPIGYEAVRVAAPVLGSCIVHAVRRPSDDADELVADLVVADPEGRALLAIDGIHLRGLDPETFAAEPAVGASALSATHTLREHGVLDLVEPLGLRAEDALPWFDRLVSADIDRLIVTSFDLELLRHAPTSTSDALPDPGGSAVGLDERLVGMWKELLGVGEVGADDDFFDLGGHSLMAIRLMTRIKRELGVRFELSAIFEAPTVALLAALIRQHRPDIDTELTPSGDDGAVAAIEGGPGPARKQLVTISSRGEGRPFYVVHGAGGNVLFLSTLARALGGDRPILGFQAVGVNEGELPDRSIEEMAARYVAELRAHSSGPYLLGGYSGGGIVALEMARQLAELGDTVDHVVLFDSPPPGTLWPGTRTRWARLARRLLAGEFAVVKAHATRQVKNSLRRVFPEPAERGDEHDAQERALGYVAADTGFVNLFYYFSATAEQYRPATYDVDATIVKADEVWPVHPDNYGWTGHIAGRLTWRTVPGDHHSMFYPHNAPALARVVRTILDPFDASGVRGDTDGGGVVAERP